MVSTLVILVRCSRNGPRQESDTPTPYGVLCVVKVEIGGQAFFQLRAFVMYVQVNILILEGAQPPFNKDIVQDAPAAIHADAHACSL